MTAETRRQQGMKRDQLWITLTYLSHSNFRCDQVVIYASSHRTKEKMICTGALGVKYVASLMSQSGEVLLLITAHMG